MELYGHFFMNVYEWPEGCAVIVNKEHIQINKLSIVYSIQMIFVSFYYIYCN